jgi:hypothetical protein
VHDVGRHRAAMAVAGLFGGGKVRTSRDVTGCKPPRGSIQAEGLAGVKQKAPARGIGAKSS